MTSARVLGTARNDERDLLLLLMFWEPNLGTALSKIDLQPEQFRAKDYGIVFRCLKHQARRKQFDVIKLADAINRDPAWASNRSSALLLSSLMDKVLAVECFQVDVLVDRIKGRAAK